MAHASGQLTSSTCQQLTARCGRAAGLPNEAVAVLQEAGLWRYAATLAALQLSGDEKAAALERWAAHIHQARPHRISQIQSGHVHAGQCAIKGMWQASVP